MDRIWSIFSNSFAGGTGIHQAEAESTAAAETGESFFYWRIISGRYARAMELPSKQSLKIVFLSMEDEEKFSQGYRR